MVQTTIQLHRGKIMCNPLAVVMAVSAVASGAQQQYNANKQEKMANRQESEQKALAAQQANTRDSASSNYLFDVNTENSGGSGVGLGNTFLTGSQGVSNDQLNLGGVKNKLGA